MAARAAAQRRPGTSTPWARLAAPGLVLLAGTTAMLGLGHQPLWFDEIATAYASGLPWHGLRTLLGQTDANLGAYYALLHLLRTAAGSGGAAVLRLPSALASVATVLVTERVGRRVLGRRPALAAAALLAVHPFATAYARDARPYAVVALCCTVALLLGLRAAERPTVGRLAAYAGVVALAVCLHLYAVLVLGSYAVALLPGVDRRRWLLTHLALLPVVLVVLAVSLRQSAQLSWVPGLSVGRVGSGLALLAGGVFPLVVLVAGLGVVATDHALAGRPRRVLLAGLVLPVAALLAASAVSPTFVPRYLVATVPVQCLVVASAGTALVRRSALRRAVPVTAVLLAGWFGVGTVSQATVPYRYEDYRAASSALLQAAQHGDGIVYEQDGARLGLDYYLDLSRKPLPHDVLAVPGAVARGFSVPDRTGAAAALALADFRRVWVVRHLDARPNAVPGLSRYRCASGQRFGAVALQLCLQRVS